MITPNRFVELESIESKKILLVNDPSHEKINNLKFHDIIIFCETLHPLLDEDIENICQKYADRFIVIIATRQISKEFETKYNCKIITIRSADVWYNKLLPKYDIDFNNKLIEKYFISLNGRGQWNRHALFQAILNFNLLDYCYFSYLMTDRFTQGKQALYDQLNETAGRCWYNEKIDLKKLIDQIPFIHGVSEKGLTASDSDPYNILDIEQYRKSFFSVVSETYVGNYVEPFLSEKTFRAIACGLPFIISSAPGAFTKLKAQGFESFYLIFDETYDHEQSPQKRFEMIIRQLNEICKLSLSDINDMYRNIKPVCEHNYNYFWYEWQTVYDREIIEVKSHLEEIL